MFGNLIIDGPDATGKSTLCEYIANKFGYNIIHSEAKSKNDYEYHSDLIKNGDSKICDRFMAGEYVYPQIYGRPAKLNLEEMEKLFKEIVESNSLYIIMNASNLDILNERLIERGEYNYLEEIKEQQILFNKFYYVFQKYFDEYDNFVYVDICNKNSYKDIYSYTEEFINKHLKG